MVIVFREESGVSDTIVMHEIMFGYDSPLVRTLTNF